MNAIETLRGKNVRHLGKNKTFAVHWMARRAQFHAKLATRPVAPADIVELGVLLRDIFRAATTGGRSQSQLSGGGTTWSNLVCMYLNMCLAGTDAVAVTKSFVPKCIKDALTVSHSSATVSSDLDVVVLYFPGLSRIETTRPSLALRDIDAAVSSNLQGATVVVVQTKTNWNDGIQNPMLWNLLYKLAHMRAIPAASGMTIGKGVYTISHIGHFYYAFVTVPSNKLERFASHHATVQRAITMTGGYYWGAPTKNGVCKNVKEFLPDTFNRSGAFVPPNQLGVAFASAVNGSALDFDFAAFDF